MHPYTPIDLNAPPRRRKGRPWLAALIVLGGLALGLAFATVTHADDGDRYEPSSRGADRWADEVALYDWPQTTALDVMECESHGDPEAVNPVSGATGLMQLLPAYWQRLANALHGGWVSLKNGRVNLRTAYELWLDAGWAPWASSRACWGGW